MEQPGGGRYAPACDCHATVAGLRSPTGIRKQVRQVRKPRQECLLAPLWRCHDPSEWKKNGRFFAHLSGRIASIMRGTSGRWRQSAAAPCSARNAVTPTSSLTPVCLSNLDTIATIHSSNCLRRTFHRFLNCFIHCQFLCRSLPCL
jgi:hypothetical protein